jgi:hypothetical protein
MTILARNTDIFCRELRTRSKGTKISTLAKENRDRMIGKITGRDATLGFAPSFALITVLDYGNVYQRLLSS